MKKLLRNLIKLKLKCQILLLKYKLQRDCTNKEKLKLTKLIKLRKIMSLKGKARSAHSSPKSTQAA